MRNLKSILNPRWRSLILAMGTLQSFFLLFSFLSSSPSSLHGHQRGWQRRRWLDACATASEDSQQGGGSSSRHEGNAAAKRGSPEGARRPWQGKHRVGWEQGRAVAALSSCDWWRRVGHGCGSKGYEGLSPPADTGQYRTRPVFAGTTQLLQISFSSFQSPSPTFLNPKHVYPWSK
jgi:hypothetical protein